MDVAVEISLYPLADDYIPPIQSVIDRLNTHAGIRVETNSMSTQVFGEYATVMQVLNDEVRRTFDAEPKAVFVMKMFNLD